MSFKFVNYTTYLDSQLEPIKNQTLALAASALAAQNVKAGVRMIRPSDFALMTSPSPSSASYQWTVAAGTSTLFTFQVPTGYAISLAGWYGQNISSLGPGGSIQVTVSGNVKQEVPAFVLANAEEGFLAVPSQVVYIISNMVWNVTINNSTTVSATIGLWPIGFIAGPEKNLHTEPTLG